MNIIIVKKEINTNIKKITKFQIKKLKNSVLIKKNTYENKTPPKFVNVIFYAVIRDV